MNDPYPAATSVLSTGAVEEAPPPTHESPTTVRPVTPEKPREHPIAYAALGLSVLSVLWLAVLSSHHDNGGYQKVRVGTQDCVSVPQDSGPASLYCRK